MENKGFLSNLGHIALHIGEDVGEHVIEDGIEDIAGDAIESIL